MKENQEINKLLLEQKKDISEQNKEISEQIKQNSILINKIVEKL